ncbi:MAG: hypothetical protein OEQ47_12330 [Acidimicrobiia bacterium]|nr:hypothetical protein [Acidimicrobiia bacterium]
MFDHIVFLALVALLPWNACRRFQSLVEAVDGRDTKARMRSYRGVVVEKWLPTAVIFVAWIALSRSASSIGLILATLTGGEPRPVLWDPRDVLPLPPVAWAEIINRSAELITAAAILVDDGTETKLIGFPSAINSLLFPTQVFKDEDVALEWLRSFVD